MNKLPDGEKLRNIVSVRFTDDEFKRLRKYAFKTNFKPTSLIRDFTLNMIKGAK